MGADVNEKRKALQAFMAKIAEAKALLNEFQSYADNHMEVSPEEVNYGHVGNAGHMMERLTKLSDWAFQRGECAK
jgi:hypothetical protein